MRPLVVISKVNVASQNIKESILKMENPANRKDSFWSFPGFDMAEYEKDIIHIEPAHQADYYIFASTHKSASGAPGFSVHTPGNWGDADLGGKPRTLNTALPSKIKIIARKMRELSDSTLKWPVAVEVDHHGPTLDAPVLFAEIGSTEAEWKNPEAGRIAAQAILAAIKSDELFPSYVGFGGSHYSPKFTPKILDGGIALGHIISGYALERDGVDEGRVRQAWEKNAEQPQSALLDWKGMKGETRGKLIAALDSLKITWEKA